MEIYCLQSTRDLKSNQVVYWKIKNGQRKRRSMYQNDLWLRFIRTLILFLFFYFFIFFVRFQVFDTVNCNFLNKNVLWTQTDKKDEKSQINYWRKGKIWTYENYTFTFIFWFFEEKYLQFTIKWFLIAWYINF